MNEITNTAEMAESAWDRSDEPGDIQNDIVATHEAEGKGIEFHVSMRDHTFRDMEALIVEAAAMQIVGKFGDKRLAKAIEEKCIELIEKKATKALEAVTAEIIDQPLTPNFGDKKPVTMREFIGLTGREYLTARVDRDGKPQVESRYYASDIQPRITHMVQHFMSHQFKVEIEKIANATVSHVQKEIKAAHKAILDAEVARFRAALAKTAS